MRSLPGGVLAFLFVGVAVAASPDPRGWSAGDKAAGTAAVLGSPYAERTVIDLPKAIRARVKGPTLLVYFSPSCPHCQNVAPELAALAATLGDRATLLGVSTSNASEEQVEAFRTTYGWTFPVVIDADRAIGAAMGARSTPSVLLVRPDGKDVIAVDSWYPYAPHTDVRVELRLAPDVWSVLASGGYKGDEVCSTCHVHEGDSHALTLHSVAWRTLEKGDKTADPACVGCHVTGWGKPGGWSLGAGPEHLRDVGCEACHGPSGPHDGARDDAAASCAGCHDAKHSIAFRYDKGLPLIDHYRAATMSPGEFNGARRDVLQGDVERSLLAFEGTYVGAAACAGCHADISTSHASGPHGQAMASLRAGGMHDEVSCVVCHATASVTGPPPTTLEGYRVDEGVGCEACHGPGQAHVASKQASDIVGLGDSCPVCVIEAVCTRCHTAKWDSDWDLDEGLERSRHPGVTPPPR